MVAKTPTVVTEMIAEMDRAGIFQAELRSQNLQRGRGESGAEYELYVVYRPRAGAPTDPAALASAQTFTALQRRQSMNEQPAPSSRRANANEIRARFQKLSVSSQGGMLGSG